jgi:hypothetical protein
MSGPWGVAVGVGAAVLGPFIGKLFETGETVDQTAAKLRNAADAARELAGASNDLKLNQAKMDLNKLTEERLALENITKSKPFARDPNAGIFSPNYQLGGAKRRIAEIRQEELEPRNLITLAEQQNSELERKAAAAAARSAPAGTRSSGSRQGGSGASPGSDNGARDAAGAEVQARLAANQQIEALAEGRYQTEAELSTIALRSKIDDIEAEERAGDISGARAIEAKANVEAQIETISQASQARIFNAKLDQLEADRRNYKAGTAEYERYTRQIELLQQQHLNRQLLADARATARENVARKQANAAEITETQRAEEQKRAIQERTVAPFAQSIARMLTLQRGFIGTVRDLWGSLVGVVEQAVARMVQNFLIGLLTQEVAQEASSRKAIIGKAKEAAANAWNAVVGIPIIGPILAPAAAAASFAGVMAFASAEDGWDVPGGGGAGIDGRGGRPAIIHPREMVLPANLADTVRALPSGIAGAASVTASLRGASATVADISTGALSSPRINSDGSPRAGNRRGRPSSSNVEIHLHGAVINGSRELKRFAEANAAQLSAAGKRYARMNGR